MAEQAQCDENHPIRRFIATMQNYYLYHKRKLWTDNTDEALVHRLGMVQCVDRPLVQYLFAAKIFNKYDKGKVWTDNAGKTWIEAERDDPIHEFIAAMINFYEYQKGKIGTENADDEALQDIAMAEQAKRNDIIHEIMVELENHSEFFRREIMKENADDKPVHESQLNEVTEHIERPNSDKEKRMSPRKLSVPRRRSSRLAGTSSLVPEAPISLPEASCALCQASISQPGTSSLVPEAPISLHEASTVPGTSSQGGNRTLPVVIDDQILSEELRVKMSSSHSDDKQSQTVDGNSGKRKNSESYASSMLDEVLIEKELNLIAQYKQLHERTMEKLACEIENLKQAKRNEQEFHERTMEKLENKIENLKQASRNEQEFHELEVKRMKFDSRLENIGQSQLNSQLTRIK